MADLTVIFRTQSDVEASIVRGLLESHGVPTVVVSDLPHSIFPMAINGLGEVRISVHPEDADEARRIIESHRTELPNGRVVRLRDEFEALQHATAYRFRDRGLLEHAMTDGTPCASSKPRTTLASTSECARKMTTRSATPVNRRARRARREPQRYWATEAQRHTAE